MTDASSDEEILILQKERDGRNKIGESRLHEVARSDDYQELKNLISQGADVNQRDNGGWTPLSEAISFQKLSNVRLLLMKGAKVNVKSVECLMDENGEKMTSSGLTPLMEACLNGDVDIIKMLLQYKADVVARDDDDWTANDHLREFLLNAVGLDPKRREKLTDLIRRMDELHEKSGVKARTIEEFYELLELKRIRLKRSSQTESLGYHTATSSMTGSSNKSSATSTDADHDKRPEPFSRKRRAMVTISSDSDSDYEETRNLNEYRNAIEGLRRDHKKKPSSSSRPPAVPTRKKASVLAKRLFINSE